MSASLVGSEMCIRDRSFRCSVCLGLFMLVGALGPAGVVSRQGLWDLYACLLYTSDAADDM
eukprot:2058120-Alexandrium_andersonii.AAC.1